MTVKRGFTLVEVALFFAITGLLFLAIVAGVQTSAYQQRYNDTVQDFEEFLRSIYAEVNNVQGAKSNGGRSDKAIYGKLVTFGENETPADGNNDGAIFVYDVIGSADPQEGENGDIRNILKARGASVTYEENGEIKLASMAESYTPKWGAEIQNEDGDQLKKTLLIIRHPVSGTIHTLVKDNVLEVGGSWRSNNTLLSDAIDSFNYMPVDFCVNMLEGNLADRADVRIPARATGSSGIEAIYDGNICR